MEDNARTKEEQEKIITNIENKRVFRGNIQNRWVGVGWSGVDQPTLCIHKTVFKDACRIRG